MANFYIKTLSGEHDVTEINSTRIVLILKVGNPQNMGQFRLISLFKILYKIISKMLANRLQSIIHYCIDEAQSAFVLGQLIYDNILAAYEILHCLKNKRGGRVGSFPLKLDMSKAYNKVK